MRGDLSSIDRWARKMSTLKGAEQPDEPAKTPTRWRFLRRLFRRGAG
jgi:hypothetical protein